MHTTKGETVTDQTNQDAEAAEAAEARAIAEAIAEDGRLQTQAARQAAQRWREVATTLASIISNPPPLPAPYYVNEAAEGTSTVRLVFPHDTHTQVRHRLLGPLSDALVTADAVAADLDRQAEQVVAGTVSSLMELDVPGVCVNLDARDGA